MKKLFNIDRFSFSNNGKTISVTTDKKFWLLDKAKFEKWVDDREYRLYPNKFGGISKCEWPDFYKDHGEQCLYNYIVIQASWDKDLWGMTFDKIQQITSEFN